MKTCQACGQPIGRVAHTSAPAPSGGTWHVHLWPADCLRALAHRLNKRITEGEHTDAELKN